MFSENILLAMLGHRVVVFISTFLMTNDADCLFLCSFAIHMSSLMKDLLTPTLFFFAFSKLSYLPLGCHPVYESVVRPMCCK